LALAFLATFFTDTRGTLCPFTPMRHLRHAGRELSMRRWFRLGATQNQLFEVMR
jgi:hypothetical protein